MNRCCRGFSATEGADVGLNTGTPVTDDYKFLFALCGRNEKPTIEDKDAIEQVRLRVKSRKGLAS